jgi:phage-related protein
MRNRIRARFYELASGRKPVRLWLMDLTSDDRRNVSYDIQTVEFGWPIVMPVCRPPGGGLYEVRTHLTDGRIGRVLFCIIENEMMQQYDFVKKAQKTPPTDLV